MTSLVSILTPCYEHEHYLSDYFESLLGQTYSDIELIFCDDASGDGSWAKALAHRESLENRFHRVVLRRNEENIGLLGTLGRMKSEIRGEVVCILESDDYLYRTKVEENVAYLREHPEVGLVHSDADFLYTKENRLQRSYWRSRGRRPPVGGVFEQLLYENFIVTCTVACRASLVEDHVDFRSYRERGYRTADYPMFLDLSRQAPFGYIDRSLAVYRVVEGSISHPATEIGRLEWELDYFRIKQNYVGDRRCPPRIRRRAEIQLHLRLMQLGWASGSREMFAQGHSWLLENDPESIGWWAEQVWRRSIHHGAIWRAVRRLEAWGIGPPLLERARGWARRP